MFYNIYRFRHISVCLIAGLLLSACSIAPKSVDESNIPPITSKEQNLIQLARASEGGQSIAPAAQLYKQAMNQSKGSIEAHLALANLYDRRASREQALEIMLKAKKLQPTHPMLNQQLGKYYVSKNQGEKSLGFFDDGLKREPNHIDLLNGRGVALDMLSRHNEAQASYSKALATMPDKTDFIYNNFAMSHIMAGEYKSAIKMLLSIKKKDETMRQNLAMAYGMAGNVRKAKKWGRKDISKSNMKSNLKFYKSYDKAINNMILRDIIPIDKPKIK